VIGTHRQRHWGQGQQEQAWVAISSKAELLASGGIWLDHLRVWDVSTGRERGDFTSVSGLPVFLPRAKKILCARAGLALVDVESGKIEDLKALPGLSTYAVSPNGELIAVEAPSLDAQGHVQHHIRLLELPTGRERLVVAKSENIWSFLAFSPDGKTLASASRHGRGVILWDTGSGKQLKTLQNTVQLGGIESLSFTSQGKIVVGGGDAVRIFDPSTGKELVSLPHGLNTGWPRPASHAVRLSRRPQSFDFS